MTEDGDGFFGSSYHAVGDAQFVQSEKGTGVVTALDPLALGGDLLEDGDGLLGTPGFVIGSSYVTPSSEGLGVVTAQEPLTCRRDLPEYRSRLFGSGSRSNNTRRGC